MDTPYLLRLLSNDAIPFFDNFILWMNIFGAAFAACWNICAVRATQIQGNRTTHSVIAALAIVYVLAYLVLLVGDLDLVGWSSVMRGVSLVVWPAVWAWPAVRTVGTARTLQRITDYVDEIEAD